MTDKDYSPSSQEDDVSSKWNVSSQRSQIAFQNHRTIHDDKDRPRQHGRDDDDGTTVHSHDEASGLLEDDIICGIVQAYEVFCNGRRSDESKMAEYLQKMKIETGLGEEIDKAYRKAEEGGLLRP